MLSPSPGPTICPLPHASSYRLLWLHICVWNVLTLTFHCCSALQRPLLSKTLLSSLTSRSCNLLDAVAKNSLGWITAAQTMLIPISEYICISLLHCTTESHEILLFRASIFQTTKLKLGMVRLPQNIFLLYLLRITNVLRLTEKCMKCFNWSFGAYIPFVFSRKVQ